MAATLPLLVGLTACGDDGESDSDGPVVLATTGILADIASNVAGPGVSVEQLIPDGASPHDFQLSAEDRQRLEEADLVVANGAGLEASLPLDDLDAPVWELSANVGDLLPTEGFEDGDPHVWMDPQRVTHAIPSLAVALDEAGAAGSDERAVAYVEELLTVDRDVAAALRVVPATERELVTSHDALGYFADRYGFDVIATAFPASGPEAEPSAAALDDVLTAIEESGVPAVFAAAEDDPKTLATVAGEAGVAIEDGLLVESPGEDGTYAGMLRTDGDLIARALGG